MNTDAQKARFSQFITRTASTYTPLQKVLVVCAGVLIAGALVSLIIVGVIWGSGLLVSDPSTAAERTLIDAQATLRKARATARKNPSSSTARTAVLRARARVVLAQLKDDTLEENARAGADELYSSGSDDPLVLYAIARAYETDTATSGRSFNALARAASSVGAQAGELSRTIYETYARRLIKKGEQQKAVDYLKKAAEISPTSTALLLETGKLYEAQSAWFEAGVCYYRALALNPQDSSAAKAVSGLVALQPEKAAAAKSEVAREYPAPGQSQ